MIFVVTALHAEARPLLEHFGLEGSDAAAPFRTYRSSEMLLVVSGVGRVACAAATAYAFAHAGEPRDRPWINVGIAGHRTWPVGACRLARKISEASSDRTWYPSLVFDPGIPTADVVTVDRPESRFEGHALYDMEASAFFAVASRVAPVELIQVLKVVSDNRSEPAEGLKPADLSRLVRNRIEEIASLIAGTASLADSVASRTTRVPDPAAWMGERRFTVSQRRRLEELLRRLTVVEEGAELRPDGFETAVSAAELLRNLEERLESRGAGF